MTDRSDVRRIKVIQVIADSEIGGGPKHVLGLLENLDQDKFDLFLAFPAGWLERKAGEIGGVGVFRIDFKSKFDLGSLVQFREIVSKIRTDHDPFGPLIIHSHGPRAGFVARFKRIVGAKNIYTEHIYTGDYHLGNSINEWLQKNLLKRLNFKSDLVIAVSTAVKDYLLKSGLAPKNRTIIIPNGIELRDNKRELRATESGKGVMIGTIGNLNKQKGQKYLIEALPTILEKYPEAKLEIVGEGPEYDNLKFLIFNLKLEGRVSLPGKQENTRKYLEKWDTFVLPSISETFGVAILESFAVGIPVVASEVGGIKDIVQDGQNGLLAKTKNPADLAEKVIRVLGDQKLAAKLIKAGNKTAEEYGWERIVKKVERAYLGIVENAKQC